ncbi:MAG: hypothetical protein IPG72_01250 [Ardenticatenales bacterium]|jgi:hypothetical protein|nr:hypothetical protein [Ardenticatenales bacterium]
MPPHLGPNAHSTLTAQNVGTENATFLVAAGPHAGTGTTSPIDRIVQSVFPGSAFRDALPSAHGLPPGDYAVRISTDRPTAAVARLSWGDGRRVMYRDVEASTDVILPLVLAKSYGQTSRIAIQNTDPDRPTRVTMTLWPSGGATPTWEKPFDVPAGSAIVLELGRDWTWPPFAGSARLVSHDAPIAVASVVELDWSDRGAYAVSGVPAERAARTLYAPLVRKMYMDFDQRTRSTGISVVNPSAAQVQVRAEYRGTSPACHDLTATEQPVTLPGHGTLVFYQPVHAALPIHCQGAAVLEADGPILAVVNHGDDKTVQSAAYPALGADEAAKTVAVPEFMLDYGPDRLYSTATVMNVGAVTATIDFAYWREGDAARLPCGAPCRYDVPPYESVTYDRSQLHPSHRGTRGSGLVTSDQPVVVVVSETSDTGSVDAASYVGIPLDAPRLGGTATPAPRERYVPWLAGGEPGGTRAQVYLPIGWR